jgi:hypothetical protein
MFPLYYTNHNGASIDNHMHAVRKILILIKSLSLCNINFDVINAIKHIFQFKFSTWSRGRKKNAIPNNTYIHKNIKPKKE